MKRWRSNLILATLIISIFFLTGCKSTLMVHNATVKDVVTILEDYVGTHGYQISYRNDALGSYRLSLGNVYVPENSQTTQTKEITHQRPMDKNQTYTAYEETTWQTVSVPGHYVEATAVVTITQQGSDIIITIDPNDAASSSLGDAGDYIKGFGYAVDNK